MPSVCEVNWLSNGELLWSILIWDLCLEADPVPPFLIRQSLDLDSQPEEKEEVDPEIEAMYKAVEELRNKQEETNQIGLLNQQNSQQLKQSADDIMKEIEAYIQQHKK